MKDTILRNGFLRTSLEKEIVDCFTRFVWLLLVKVCHKNHISVNYKSLVGSTEFEIDIDDNDWSEDIQFELQTSNWDDQKKFKIIANGKTIIEKVQIFEFSKVH